MKVTNKVVAATLFLLLACSGILLAFSCNQQTGGNKMVIVHKEQSGQEIKVKPGDIVQVELPSFGGSGYTWHVDEFDTEFMELISEETRGIEAEGKTGSPVTGIWRFRAKKEGRAEIKMDCYRSWEGKEKAVDHFSITLYNNKGQ